MSGFIAPISSMRVAAAGGSITVANAWKGFINSAPLAITVSPSAGNLIALVFIEWTSSADNTSVSDNIDSTTGWTKIVRSINGNASTVWWYKKNIPSGITTITLNRSTSATYFDGVIHEITGCSTTTPFTTGESGTNTGAATTNPTSGSLTTATASSIIFAAIENYSPSATSTFTLNQTGSTPSSGWAHKSANSWEPDGSAKQPCSVPYVVVSSTGTYAHGWTTDNYQYAASIVAFH